MKNKSIQLTINGAIGFFPKEFVEKAVEKQIPKKPKYVDTKFRYHGKSISAGQSLSKCYECPNCGTHIFYVWDDDVNCPHCG